MKKLSNIQRGLRFHRTPQGHSWIRATLLGSLLVLGLAGTVLTPAIAEAARCSADAQGNWSCTHQKRYNWYFCNGVYVPRTVRWQIPEGTPPSDGWRVAFYFAGTQLTDTSHAFSRQVGETYGKEYEPRIIHELLDDPNISGKKYAVFVADPPASGGFLQFWNTNVVLPYSASCDYDFFPDFFAEIKRGGYGAASQYNMSRRFAYGISSGGYHTSRMAVTFNTGGENDSTWKALGVLAASYATCAGPFCSVPTLPASHPPTKFWHGQNDTAVPLSTMYLYYNKLLQGGFITQKLEHPYGHEFTIDTLGASGIKSWFDLSY